MLEIKRITAGETRKLRQLTLRQHQPPEALIYPDDDGINTIHLGAFIDSELVGIASLYKDKLKGSDEPEAWRLRGMATAESVRGQGIGQMLMNHCLSHANENNGKIFWCNARTTAEKFYERFGLKRIGEESYPQDLGAHIIMAKNL